MKNKRAMTDVVATVILVALVIIAIGIVSVVIFNIVNKSSDQASLEAECIGNLVTIDSATATAVKVNRIGGSGEITGIVLELSNSTKTVQQYEIGNVNSGASKTITINNNLISNPTSVKAGVYINKTQLKTCALSSEAKITA